MAAHRLGHLLTRAHLPLITGFLLVGMAIGPQGLAFLDADAVARLGFVDEIALAFIAFAAGAELYLVELRSRLRSIRWITVGQVVATFTAATLATFALASQVAFTRGMPPATRLAVALLVGAIMVARSPSSAIAVVNEMRAHGPFTRTVLGITVASDVLVILLFALSSSMADGLISQFGFDPSLVLIVLGEIAVATVLRDPVGRAIPWLFRLFAGWHARAAVALLLGWIVFHGARTLREATAHSGPFEIYLEPLLVCMVAGFTVTNFTGFRNDFHRVLNQTSPAIYVLFFTLAGAGVAIDTLASAWQLALVLFAVRIAGIFAGSWIGGRIAGDPELWNRVSWMSFVTQAGIGLGLCKQVEVMFPSWGADLATVLISVIVLNQLVGPPLFKWALQMVGEAHLRAGRRDLRGTPLACIFGLEGQSLALARRLDAHGWRVRVITRQGLAQADAREEGVEIVQVPDLSAESLEKAGVGDAAAVVSLLEGRESLAVCELAFERFGTRTVIVRSGDRELWDELHALGAVIVDPAVAMVGLLDQFVRSPSVASMALGMDPGQEVADIELHNEDLDGVALRDLKLPLDSLILAVRRGGASLVSHGYTRLELGDRVTVVGSPESLAEISLRFAD
ncbi:MAG: potassium transporter TrkA [Acidobacteria bacterium]|nr:MAG: potassium transporter TrkA [Acidobacteriota bacterium]